MHSGGREEILGTAYHDLVVFLEAAGVDDPEGALDDSRGVEWRGGGPQEWSAP